MAGLQNRLPFYVLIPRQWQEGSFVTGKKNISEAVLFFVFFFFLPEKNRSRRRKKKRIRWVMWVIEISWVSDVAPCWRSPTPPCPPSSLPPRCAQTSSLHSAHTSALHHSALAPDRITHFPRVCLLHPNILCFSIAPSKSLTLAVSLVVLLALQSYIFFVFILSISVFYRDPSYSFFSLHLLFSLCCLLRWTYFFSSPSSEALIFFRLALEPHPSLQITHPIWTCALRTAHTNTTSIIVQCNSIN